MPRLSTAILYRLVEQLRDRATPDCQGFKRRANVRRPDCRGFKRCANVKRPDCRGISRSAGARRPDCRGISLPAGARRPDCRGIRLPASARCPDCRGIRLPAGAPDAHSGLWSCSTKRLGRLKVRKTSSTVTVIPVTGSVTSPVVKTRSVARRTSRTRTPAARLRTTTMSCPKTTSRCREAHREIRREVRLILYRRSSFQLTDGRAQERSARSRRWRYTRSP